MYDATKDKTLTESVLEASKPTERLIVSAHQYGAGPVKIQISREYTKDDGGSWKFAKLGRLTLDEVAAVSVALDEVSAAVLQKA